MDRKKIICITPVKNEAWIIRHFLGSASRWADHIILADQASTDGTREIAATFAKVTLIDNPEVQFDAGARRKLLVEAARKIDPHAILIGLDADEILSATALDSPEWETICQTAPGTRIYFDLVNLTPDLKHCWMHATAHEGYVDDGADYLSKPLHEPRLPGTKESPLLKCSDIKVLHYNYTAEERVEAKTHYYQLLERVQEPDGSGIRKFRSYYKQRMDPSKLDAVDPAWFDGYRQQGVDVTSLSIDPNHHLDSQSVKLLKQHGAAFFAKDFVWFYDWESAYTNEGEPFTLRDPRSWLQKKVHAYLWKTQTRRFKPWVRAIDHLLIQWGF